jgi:hypothetical protein
MGISPRVLAELLGRAGYPITERRLTQWGARRWIPRVCRGERPTGTGRGAYYEWPDREIIAQVFTLLNMFALRGRMETASLLAWFSGFHVPYDDIRSLWVDFESLRLGKTLQAAGAESTVKDAVNWLVSEEQVKQRKKKDGYSDGFVDFITRMGVDPALDVRTYLSSERVAMILAGNPKLVEFGTAIASMLSADTVRSFAILVQPYWSTPRLKEVIQSVPDEMLTKAHADVRFLLDPYRAWVEWSVSKMADGRITDFEQTALWVGPLLAWRAGRFLMQLNIALRDLGYGDEVDVTMAMLRDVAAKDETREVVSALKRGWQTLASSYAPGLGKDATDAIAQDLRRDPAYDKIAEIFQSIGPALKDLWLPRLQLALAEAAMEGIKNPAASMGRHRPTTDDYRGGGGDALPGPPRGCAGLA